MPADPQTWLELLTPFDLIVGFFLGGVAWFAARYIVAGFFTVDQNERAVKTVLGRAVAARRRDDAR